MSRVVLIHFDETEYEEHAQRLKRSNYEVVGLSGEGAAGLRAIGDDPPDAVVIDLSRLPSQGRAIGTALRQQKATRQVPIVFVAGDTDKVARVRRELPDATYTQWRSIREALRRAIARPPREPIVPGTMDAYAGTPLPKKLGIKADTVLTLLGAPKGFERTLGDLRKSLRIKTIAGGHADVAMLFVTSAADLNRRLTSAARAASMGGRLWVVWPKKASGAASDLSQAIVRQAGLDAGLVDFKICAIDETWSGLCFARRRDTE